MLQRLERRLGGVAQCVASLRSWFLRFVNAACILVVSKALLYVVVCSHDTSTLTPLICMQEIYRFFVNQHRLLQPLEQFV